MHEIEMLLMHVEEDGSINVVGYFDGTPFMSDDPADASGYLADMVKKYVEGL